MWFLAFLFSQTSVHAGAFTACEQARPLARFDLPSRGRCSRFQTGLDQLSPFMKHSIQSHDAEKAGALLAPKVLDALDRQIDARTRLITCFDQPASPECAAKLKGLRDNVQRHLARYRTALALAGNSASPSASIDALDPNIRALPVLGGRALPPLTSAEYWRVRKLHDAALSAEDTFAGRDLQGHPISKNDFIARCERNHDEPACVEYAGVKANAQIHLRQTAARVALTTLAELPLISQFDQTPVADATIRSALESTRAALKDWRGRIAASPDVDSLMMDYPNLMDEVLGAHPEWCASIEHRYVHNRSMGVLKKYSVIGAATVAATGLCLYSAGMACGAANLALNGAQALMASSRYDQALERFQASEDDRLVRSKDLVTTHDDFLTLLSFTGVQSLPISVVAKVATKGYLSAEETAEHINEDREEKEHLAEDEKLGKQLDGL